MPGPVHVLQKTLSPECVRLAAPQLPDFGTLEQGLQEKGFSVHQTNAISIAGTLAQLCPACQGPGLGVPFGV